MSCRTGALRGGGHFVTCIGLREVLPLVGTSISRDQRERHPKGYTSHEVTAARAGRPSGRTRLYSFSHASQAASARSH
jgi:hypothetical protein